MSRGRRDIQIRFIRRMPDGSADTNTGRNDLLRIAYLNENSKRILYIERSDEYATIDLVVCDNQQLLAYLYRLLWLTSLDEDPFHSVRFHIPGFPSMAMSVASVQAYIPNLLDIILSLCWNWPTIGYAPIHDERLVQHSVRSPEEPAHNGDNEHCTNST
jgi:hypothetical protein